MPNDADIAGDLQVIVPNLHWRYTGVTATSRMVSPHLAKLFRAAWLGSDAPEGIARMGFGDLLKLCASIGVRDRVLYGAQNAAVLRPAPRLEPIQGFSEAGASRIRLQRV